MPMVVDCARLRLARGYVWRRCRCCDDLVALPMRFRVCCRCVARLRRWSSAPEGSTCTACGLPCTETDRGLVVMHHACVASIKEIVARESRPYRTSEYGGGGEHR
jgi:hypothetical protein